MKISIQQHLKGTQYAAFTLLEILLVLIISMTLMSMSIFSIIAMRNNIMLSETTDRVSSDLRYVRNSSLLLQRDPSDNWIYGVGIDFGDSESVGYTMFKWCSPYTDYGDGNTMSDVPNYSDIPYGSVGTARIPTSYSTVCNNNVLVELGGRYAQYDFDAIEAQLRLRNEAGSIVGYPRFVLFESLTGRAFFYDKNGNLLNFQILPSGPQIVGETQEGDLDIELGIPQRSNVQHIELAHISGEINILEN